MDEKDCVIIETEWMRGIISGLVHKALESKGVDADIQFYKVVIENRNEKVQADLNISVSIDVGELKNILGKIM